MRYAKRTKSTDKRVEDWESLKKAGLICLDGDFFPSVHYPPITMYPPIEPDRLFEGYESPEGGRFSLYVHIPFCKSRCAFCHYPNRYGRRETEKERYIDALLKEMDLYTERLGLSRFRASSILVGGGTPTLFSPAQLERFHQGFEARVDLSECTQFNYDVDPQTLLGAEGAERLKVLRSHGVQRLTIGIQSLDEAVLRSMTRHHNSNEALEAVKRSLEAGFLVNIEFIYGWPGQSLESWISDMETAVSLGVHEIQVYRIKIVPYGDYQGLISRDPPSGEERQALFEAAIRMKQIAALILTEHGYHENLRRVYSLEACHYSHYADDQCCKLVDQLGFGLSAFSSLRDRFGLNTQSMEEYFASLSSGELPVNRGLVRDRDAELRWHIVLPLKNRNVLKQAYEEQTGVSLDRVFRKKIERLKRFDLIREDDEVLELTEKGVFFADEVCHQFHHPDYMPFAREAYAKGELNPFDDWEP